MEQKTVNTPERVMELKEIAKKCDQELTEQQKQLAAAYLNGMVAAKMTLELQKEAG